MKLYIFAYGGICCYMGTIFVAGIYGVGKSTLCNNLSKELGIPEYSAGDLISSVNGEQYGANKAVTDKTSNQVILALQVQRLLEITPKILLAGHFCIFDRDNNIDYLPESVFPDLKIEKILLLNAPISTILTNLSLRDKKIYTKQQIKSLRKAEEQRAKEISHKIGCKLYLHNMVFGSTDISKCLAYIREDNL